MSIDDARTEKRLRSLLLDDREMTRFMHGYIWLMISQISMYVNAAIEGHIWKNIDSILLSDIAKTQDTWHAISNTYTAICQT